VEFSKIETAEIAKVIEDSGEGHVVELCELNLLLVGGGVGEVIMA
jgi:hypothetical protein